VGVKVKVALRSLEVAVAVLVEVQQIALETAILLTEEMV
jgi:hypothetical protein